MALIWISTIEKWQRLDQAIRKGEYGLEEVIEELVKIMEESEKEAKDSGYVKVRSIEVPAEWLEEGKKRKAKAQQELAEYTNKKI